MMVKIAVVETREELYEKAGVAVGAQVALVARTAHPVPRQVLEGDAIAVLAVRRIGERKLWECERAYLGDTLKKAEQWAEPKPMVPSAVEWKLSEARRILQDADVSTYQRRDEFGSTVEMVPKIVLREVGELVAQAIAEIRYEKRVERWGGIS